ncbi:hypothetical protein PSTG_17183, partial [Puccinia striiformis f. sp. tritici PST-78]
MLTSSKLEAKGTAFNTALIQLRGIGSDKPTNLLHAWTKITEAMRGHSLGLKPHVFVLPEIFNSPYRPSYFDTYAEVIGWHESKGSDWDVE